MIRKSKMKNKYNALMWHVCKRAKQRLNLDLNEQQIKDMAMMCKNGKCQHVETISGTKSIKILTFLGKKFPVIYNKGRKMIVTILTDKMLENREEWLKEREEY